jgi:hypothetical protein
MVARTGMAPASAGSFALTGVMAAGLRLSRVTLRERRGFSTGPAITACYAQQQINTTP